MEQTLIRVEQISPVPSARFLDLLWLISWYQTDCSGPSDPVRNGRGEITPLIGVNSLQLPLYKANYN